MLSLLMPFAAAAIFAYSDDFSSDAAASPLRCYMPPCRLRLTRHYAQRV